MTAIIIGLTLGSIFWLGYWLGYREGIETGRRDRGEQER